MPPPANNQNRQRRGQWMPRKPPPGQKRIPPRPGSIDPSLCLGMSGDLTASRARRASPIRPRQLAAGQGRSPRRRRLRGQAVQRSRISARPLRDASNSSDHIGGATTFWSSTGKPQAGAASGESSCGAGLSGYEYRASSTHHRCVTPHGTAYPDSMASATSLSRAARSWVGTAVDDIKRH